ncbi:speckle targeted PIP5K1A-regulated poly(A) polymerase-like [Argiope bruennichi]|uniref:speckle targeted PIP5K1A-regulated poly(A) polymerase-like n=1 Tax=Argiope bruennichi TaxID=94029 RepID=UPI002493E7F8|nr:speckle targeted PIP5K1A-regulated poly(A) polymerase-like [Argiope bruennichi]
MNCVFKTVYFTMNPCVSSTRTLISKWIKSHHCKSILCASNIETNAIIFCQIHCGWKVNNYYRFVPKIRDAENKSKALSHTYLKQLLQNCKSVKEQIETFDSYVKLTDEDISHRNSVCHDIEKIFKSHFPNCSVHLTGSSVSGLGLKGCDVDLSFQPSADENNEINPIKDLSSDSVKDIKLGKVPVCNFSSLLPRRQLHLLKNALMNSGAIKESAVVPGHCPILNFTYQNLSCDVSVDNKSALGGTNLMLLCRLLDDRFAPLYRFISYWAKHYHLCGGPMKLKSYAIFLLIVYFLQTRDPPILPTVQYMFDKTDFINNQDNWSYDVSKYLDRFGSSQNPQTIDELLQEFFFFYTKFDFLNVICPLTSQIENARDFISKNDSDENKFQVAEISIQDPFNRDWNVTSGVSHKYSRHFKQDLSLMCKAYNTEKYWKPSFENWGLLCLFEVLNERKSNKK